MGFGSTSLHVLILLALSAPLAAAAQTKLVDALGEVGDFAGGGVGTLNPNFAGPGVAIDGDVIVFGAIGDDAPPENNTGAAVVFRHDGAEWVQEQRMWLPDGKQSDWFGSSVAVSGDVIAVGTPWRTKLGVAAQGSISMYRWNGSTWAAEQEVFAFIPTAWNLMGASLALDGDVVVAGAPFHNGVGAGTATVFRWNGLQWREEQTLARPDIVAGEYFGAAVAVDGDVIAVAAPHDDFEKGSVTIFRWNGLTWDEEQVIVDDAPETFDSFGRTVALSGDVLVVGVPGDDATGSAKVYCWNGAVWAHEQTLVHGQSVPTSYSTIPTAVAIDGDAIVVGWSHDTVGGLVEAGSASVYRWDGASWHATQVLVAGDPQEEEFHGTSVAVGGGLAVAGAPRHDTPILWEGAVYVHEVLSDPWANEGYALAGVNGPPLLGGHGPLAAGSGNQIALGNAAPSAPAGIFLALSSTPVPFKGGTLAAFPFLIDPVLVPTNALGAFTLAFGMPPGLPSGSSLWVQAAVQDVAAPNGVALSNAVSGDVP